MLEGECFVLCMKLLMEQCAEFEIVLIRRSLAHKHVNNIRRTGIVILFVTVVKDYKVFIGFYNNQKKIYLGYLKVKAGLAFQKLKTSLLYVFKKARMLSLMMRLLLRDHYKTIFLLLVSTVWRPFVLRVVLLLLGRITYKYLAVFAKGLSN
jgi:hypothetical protein